MKKILIYFGDQSQKTDAVKQALNEINADYHILSDKDITQKVGTLLNLDGYHKIEDTQEVHHSIDLMFFEEATDEEILQLNEALKKYNVEMKRKAMLTIHNKDWIFHDLLNEIEQEHKYFQYREAIRTILVDSQNLVIEHYTPTSWKQYEQAFYHAYECFTKQCELPEIEQAYNQLVKAKNELQKV